MKISQKQYFIIFLVFVSIFLLYYIFILINHLYNEKYITECFTQNLIREKNNNNLTHTVDIPLTNIYSCNNFCGPTSKCAITGEQCFSDIDCSGCRPPYLNNSKKPKECINGNDDSGKLTVGVTPTYSALTSGFGTKERVITKDLYSRVPQANFGFNIWIDKFNEEETLFNKRYKPKNLKYMPNYKKTPTLSGLFVTDGPLPSNY